MARINRWYRHTIVGLGLLSVVVDPAAAQFYVPSPEMLSMSSFINDAYLSNQGLDKSQRNSDAPHPKRDMNSPRSAPTTPVVAEGMSSPFMPAKLAENYPLAERSKTTATFETMLSTYTQLERKFGITHGDLAASLAGMIYGSYTAYHGTAPPDAAFPAMAHQLRDAVSSNSALRNAAAREKQALYERFAILGTYLTAAQLELDKKPDPAIEQRLRMAGRKYLAELVGGDPDSVRIDANGMHAAP